MDFARQLEKLSDHAVPLAVRNVLNDLAFAARKRWPIEMGDAFTLRNRWTVGSVRVDRAILGDVSAMQSRVGSLAEYLAMHEAGGTRTRGGKHGAAVPSAAAARQSGRRTRPIAQALQRKKLKGVVALSSIDGSSRKQRIAIAISLARKRTAKAVYLDGPKPGIYKVGGREGVSKLRLLWSMRGSVPVPKHDTLAVTTEYVMRTVDRVAIARLREQYFRIFK